tara:strand:- start:1186 stop:1911 length:726 start_codon:yes stop_codon:yes gene_type:complete
MGETMKIEMTDYIDQKTNDRAIDQNDADAQYTLARAFRQIIIDLPDLAKEAGLTNKKMREQRLLYTNEFHKWLKEAAINGSELANSSISALTEKNAIPLEEYDGKVFNALADLANAGDKDAQKPMKTIALGLKSALSGRFESLNLPGKFEAWPHEKVQQLDTARSERDIHLLQSEVQKIHQAFEKIINQTDDKHSLKAHYNKQAQDLGTITNGLKVYEGMLKTLPEILEIPNHRHRNFEIS